MAEGTDPLEIVFVPQGQAVEQWLDGIEERAARTVPVGGGQATGTQAPHPGGPMPPPSGAHQAPRAVVPPPAPRGGPEGLPPHIARQIAADLGVSPQQLDPRVVARVERNWDARDFAVERTARREADRVRDQQVAAAMRSTEVRNREMSRTGARVDRNWEAAEFAQEKERRRKLNHAIELEANARLEMAKASERFAAEQRTRMARERGGAARLSDAQFRSDLAEVGGSAWFGAGPGRQRRMIRERMGGMDPDSIEFANLQRQDRALAGRSGMNRSVIPMGVFFNAMFGGWELATAYNASMQMNNPLMNRGMMQRLQTQQAAIQQMGGGIFSGMVMGGANLIDQASLGIGFGTSNMQRGFGFLGNYSPMAYQQAQARAMEGMEAAQAQVNSAIQLRADRQAGIRTLDAAVLANIRDPFARERFQAMGATVEAFGARADERIALNLQLAQAKTAGDTKAIADITARQAQMRRVEPELVEAELILEKARLAEIDFRRGLMTVGLRYGNTAARARMSGDFEAAGLADVGGQFAPMFATFGQTPEIQEAYRLAIQQVQQDVRRTGILQGARLGAMGATFNRMPLQAQLGQIGAQWQADMVGLDPLGFQAAQASASAMLQSQLAMQQRGDLITDVNLAQGIRRQQQAAALARDPYGMQTAGIVGRSRQEELGLLRQGLIPQAEEARKAGQRDLDILSQEYRDAFRGGQLGNKEMLFAALFNTRDLESPGGILGGIASAKGGLNTPGELTPAQTNAQLLQEIRSIRSDLVNLITK